MTQKLERITVKFERNLPRNTIFTCSKSLLWDYMSCSNSFQSFLKFMVQELLVENHSSCCVRNHIKQKMIFHFPLQSLQLLAFNLLSCVNIVNCLKLSICRKSTSFSLISALVLVMYLF